jgi:hypothetical protein
MPLLQRNVKRIHNVPGTTNHANPNDVDLLNNYAYENSWQIPLIDSDGRGFTAMQLFTE